MSSSSDNSFVLLNGAMSPNPFVTAHLRVGDNGAESTRGEAPEYSLFDNRTVSHGRLVWDAEHRRNGAASSFFSVAPVRLHLKPAECLLSVGTGDFLQLPTAPYRWIERIQIGAMTSTGAPARTIKWDFIEVDFSYSNGRTETLRSHCLPRVETRVPLRRSARTEQTTPLRHPQQFTEISARSQEVTEVKIRGQVTLRANDQMPDTSCPLLAEDLLGTIQIFTDSAPRSSDSSQ